MSIGMNACTVMEMAGGTGENARVYPLVGRMQVASGVIF